MCVHFITFPAIPNPLKIKFMSVPLLQKSVTPSTDILISVGVKLQPGGGCSCK